MKVLLDTCVVSELRHPKGDKNVQKIVDDFSVDALFLSAIVVGEIAKGIEWLENGRKKRELQIWQEDIKYMFDERILNINYQIAKIWGEISARLMKKGTQIATADGLIAATALHHNLCLMTRNTKDFVATGVRLINPWKKA